MAKPNQSQIVNLLKPNPDLETRPNDQIPRDQKEPDVDKDKLSNFLKKQLREDIMSRDDFRFSERQSWNERGYYEIKDQFFSGYPWPNASNHFEPIIPVILDAGVTEVQDAMFRDPSDSVVVNGVSPEDKRYALPVKHVLNWQNSVGNEIAEIHGSNIFRTFKNGTGFIKTWQDFGDEFRIRHASVPMHLVYKTIRGNGCQRDRCDHITQIIPMEETDWLFRRGIKNAKGKPVYEHLDLITKGFEPAESLNAEELKLLQNQITGMDVEGYESRNLRYMAETEITYYPPGKFKAIELVVWWSPRLGIIHRVIENTSRIRSWSDYWFYPSDGWAYQRSLPELLRGVQEKANYTDKQVTDASDIAVNPPSYIDRQSNVDANTILRVPTGMYEVDRGTRITVEQRNIAAIVEREKTIDKQWDKAWMRASLADVQQRIGRIKSDTLGADRMRQRQADKTSLVLLNNYNIGVRRTTEIQYELTNRGIPRKKLMSILGSLDFVNANQLFPEVEGSNSFGMGLDRKFIFAIAGKPRSVQDEEDADTLKMTAEIASSVFGKDKPTMWKVLKRRSEIRRFAEYDTIVPRPAGVDIISIEEVLQRIESGETEMAPSPVTPMDVIEYQMFRINKFKITNRYRNYDQRQQFVLQRYTQRLDVIRGFQAYADLKKRAESDPLFGDAMNEVEAEIAEGGAPPGAAGPAPRQLQ